RANIQIKGGELGFDLSDRELAAKITDKVKEREAAGYTYEGADASFELLLRSELDQLPEFFVARSWRVFTHSGKDGDVDTEATLKLQAGGTGTRVVGEGNGPVNALDHALREALLPVYPVVERFELNDYRVRILDQGHGTDATIRVLIQTTDGLRTWTTVGVGQNIIEASWEALSEAYAYGLLRADRS
ncbi:MAG: citramalate synthase, partial [Microlunatus sp.]|nr:citramalate synthase [Microlunatus sp.]